MISIVLATFNGEKYLRPQLDSLYGQTFKDFEVVACDDGSTDGTAAVLREYERKYGLRVHVNAENLGYVRNFEKAVSLSRGELIALCDQDDVWIPRKLEVLSRSLGSNLMIFSDVSLIDDQGKLMAKSAFERFRIDPRRAMDIRYMAFRNYVSGCAALFRKELLAEALPFHPEVSHDYWLAMFALSRNRLAFSGEPLVLYRQHAGNQIGFQPVNMVSSLKRISRMGATLVESRRMVEGFLAADRLGPEIQEKLRRAASVYRTLTDERRRPAAKIYCFLRYFKYLSGKNFLNWVIVRCRGKGRGAKTARRAVENKRD